MKTFKILSVCMLISLLTSAQLVIKDNPFRGALSVQFSTEERSSTTHLKITGTLNETDAEFINYNLPNLEFLDLHDATFSISEERKNVIPEGFMNSNQHIKSVILPAGSESIQTDAFVFCENLEKIILPEELEEIGDWSFLYCLKLDSIEFPGTLKSIGEYAFYRCESIKSIVLPNSIVSIGEVCFYLCSGLESIVFPENLETLPYYCLNQCSKLKNVTLPSTLKYIDNYAFGWAESLESIILPETLIEIDTGAFYNCSSLKLIEIPDQLTTIRTATFSNCTALESISIPNNITTLESSIFYGCISLDTLYIPSSVVAISNDAFNGYNGYIKFDEDNQALSYVGDLILNKELTKLIRCPASKTGTCYIPNTVEEIGVNAFNGCDTLEIIEIPESVKTINIQGINNCSAQFKVDISNMNFSSLDGVLYNKDQTILLRCPALKEGILQVPKSVVSIGDLAFVDCLRLLKVEIPMKTSAIPLSSFYNCSAAFSVDIDNNNYSSSDSVLYDKNQLILIKVPVSTTELNSIPKTVEYLAANSFYNSKIKSISIPEGVKSIGNYAFESCSDLSKVELPSTIKEIGNYAFAYLEKLDSIIIHNTTPIQNMSYNVFYETDQSCKLLVPFGMKSDYSSIYPWNSFEQIEELKGARFSKNNVLILEPEEGSEERLSIFSNTTWKIEIEIDADWLSLSKYEGEGNTGIRFTATENPNNKNRITYVYLKVEGNLDVKLKIVQSANQTAVSAIDLAKNEMRIYPNPVSDYLHITGLNETSQLQIFDVNAKQIISRNIQVSEPVSIQHLKKGQYFVIVQNSILKKVFQIQKR